MITSTNITGIYIVHGIKGYDEREHRLKNIFTNELQVPVEFVTESYNDDENKQLIQQYFNEGVSSYLSKGAIYCTLVHILIYEKIVAAKHPMALVFENDVCFIGNNFISNVQKVAKEAATLEPGFMISLENATLEFPSIYKVKRNKYLYPAKKGRCAGAYLIDYTAAEIMLNDLKQQKCTAVIDWWHNDMIDRNVLKMFWAHPPLTEQGSFNGTLSSSISIRSNGWIRRFKWLSQKYYKMYILRLFKL
ncbi:MAG: glycosyltransferase family 25 protein [Chitinophagaceae bacterium]